MNENTRNLDGFSPDVPEKRESLQIGAQVSISELANHQDRQHLTFTINGKEGEYILYADGKTINRVWVSKRESDGAHLRGKTTTNPSKEEAIDENTIVTIAGNRVD